MSVSQAAPSASTVRALVRGTRTALFVQLLVAVLAVGATVFAIVETQRLQQRRDQLAGEITELESVRDGFMRANVAASAGYQNWQKWLGGGRREDLDAAAGAFAAALEDAPNDPSLLNALAQVQFAQGDAAAAAQSMRQAIDGTGEGEAPAYTDVARLTAYQCAAGDVAGARRTFASAPDGFAAALRADVALADARAILLRACANAALPASVAAAPTENAEVSVRATADDAYRISIVWLHIRSESDRADAERLAAALRERGVRVPGIELVAPPRGYSANVRYYYEQQAAQAHEITGWMMDSARSLGLAGWSERAPREVSLAGRYDRLPRDRMEVWLPPRASAQ